jgi:hypothetical protein
MQDLNQLTQLFDSAWEANDFAAALRHATAAARRSRRPALNKSATNVSPSSRFLPQLGGVQLR